MTTQDRASILAALDLREWRGLGDLSIGLAIPPWQLADDLEALWRAGDVDRRERGGVVMWRLVPTLPFADPEDLP